MWYLPKRIDVAGVLFLVGLVSCVKIPETGKSALLLTSPSFENQLGAGGYKEILAKSKINQDPRLNDLLRRVATRIAAQTRRSDFKWEFKLIESKEKNAWCMPGGKIAVYTAILPDMMNEAGMATVLGHEVAHATLRHAGQRISQQMVVNLGLSLAEISLGNSAQRDTIIGLLGAGATVGVILPYSRDHESEADLVGLRYMAGAGYDPQESIQFWKRFSKSSGGAPPEFLSTHPGTTTRISDLQNHLAEANRRYQTASQKYGSGEKI